MQRVCHFQREKWETNVAQSRQAPLAPPEAVEGGSALKITEKDGTSACIELGGSVVAEGLLISST